MEYVLQARKIGVAGYLLKDAATAELEQALHAVAQGRTYLSPQIFRR
jgi:DNA-binding NarL/FixJ family response regulator